MAIVTWCYPIVTVLIVILGVQFISWWQSSAVSKGNVAYVHLNVSLNSSLFLGCSKILWYCWLFLWSKFFKFLLVDQQTMSSLEVGEQVTLKFCQYRWLKRKKVDQISDCLICLLDSHQRWDVNNIIVIRIAGTLQEVVLFQHKLDNVNIINMVIASSIKSIHFN